MRTTFHSDKKKPYSVKDMAKYIRSKYEIDFYETSYEALKTQAFVKKSHLIDIACDIKELLRDNNRIKYDHIGTLLELFAKKIHDPLEQ